jgi:ATP-dependent protease ClpP protease subunit
MTKRPLPDLRLPPVRADVAADLPERALAAWDRGLTAAAGETTITIFDVIGDYGDNGVSVARIAAALRAIGDRPVTVQINSPGGSYDDGLAIYNLLRAHEPAVTVQVIGMAASAASIIAMAADDLQIGRSAHMMIHNVQWLAIGDRRAMAAAAAAMQIFDDTLARLYAARSGIDVAEIARMMDAETYLSGERAVELGLADGFLPADPARGEPPAGRPLAFEVEAALRKSGWSRAAARRAIRDIRGMPRAAQAGTPRAAETGAGDGLATLRLAAARLSLLRL